MTFSKKPSPPGLNDPVLARQTEADLAKASLIARGKPTVTSAGELILPSTTLSTTSNSFTTTTSANNQTADTVTVTRTSGSVYVSSIDQTIQQTVINNPVAGVSSIIAGNNISITSTGTSGTGDVTINAIVGNIATINLDGNVSNVLRGDGTFSADANSSYGNSNVTSLLGAFGSNTISTTGIITANGANLSNVPYANLTGAPLLGNISSINLDGNVSNLLTGNGTYVAIPVVPTVGNIATLNLDGSNSNVLYGNGVFAAIAGGANTGNVTFDNNIVIGTGDEFGSAGLFLAPGNGSIANSAVQYLRVRGGDAPTHIHLDTGNNQFYDQYFGDDAKYVKLELGDAGNIVIGTDDAAGNSYNWTFTSGGNLILANGNGVIQSIANSSLDILNPNVSTMVLTPDPGYGSQALVLDPTTTGHIHLRSPGSSIDQPSANLFLGGEASSFEVGQYNGAVPNLFIHSNNNTWTFDIDGNLTLPQLTTISDESGVGTTLTVGVPPTVIVISGADFSAVNTTYTKTSATTPTWEPAGYNPATDPYIEFTGGQYGILVPGFGAALYVNTGTLNVPLAQWNTNPPLGSVAPVGVYTYGASGPDWVFGDDGLLTLPGGNVTIGSVLGGEAILASNTPFGVVSQGNGSTVLQWIDDIANATALSAIYINSPSGNTGDVTVLTGEPGANANIWTFGADGILTVPGGLVAVSASPAPVISGFSSVSALQFTNGNSNVTINANSNLWTFDSTGNLKLPGNTFSVNYANGSQASAPLVDVLNTNGLTTVFYPTFVENRTDGQIVRADVDLSYRTDTNTLTVGNVTAINLINTVTVYANLPAATTAGIRAFISDANLVAAGNFGATVGSGGSNTVPVYSDGTNWCIG